MDGITNSMDMSLSELQEMVKGSLACFGPWNRKESDMTERLNNNNNIYKVLWKISERGIGWDFPGGPVVKTLYFHCRGHKFNPWWGN